MPGKDLSITKVQTKLHSVHVILYTRRNCTYIHITFEKRHCRQMKGEGKRSTLDLTITKMSNV